MDLLLSRRWKPSRVRSGGWRVTWLRSGPCYRLQRLYPAPEKKASRWDGRTKWFHLISTWCDLQDKKRPKSINAKWWFVLKDLFFWMSLCLQTVEQKIQSMRRTVAEIQKCKPGLCLPDKAEETLTVFTVVDQLQTLLLELEKVSMHQLISESVLEVHWTSELYWTFCFHLVEGPCSVHPAASDSGPNQSSVSSAGDLSASTPEIHLSGGWGELFVSSNI